MFKRTVTKSICLFTILALTLGLWGQQAGATTKHRALKPVDKVARLMMAQALIKANFKQPEGHFGGMQTFGVTAPSGWSYVYKFWNPQTAVGKDVHQLAQELGRPYQRMSISPTGKVIRDAYAHHVRTKEARTKDGRYVLDLTFKDKSVSYIMPVKVRYEPATGEATITEKWVEARQPNKVETEVRTIKVTKNLSPGYELYTVLHDKLWTFRCAPLHIGDAPVNGFPAK